MSDSTDRGKPAPDTRTPLLAVIPTDERGCVTAWGREAEELTGLDAEEMIGQPAWEICSRLAPEGTDPEIVRRRVRRMLEAALASGQLSGIRKSAVFTLRRPDGVLRKVEHQLTLVESPEGNRIVGVVWDAGGAEAASWAGALPAESTASAAEGREAFMETIIASAGGGIIVYDRELRILVWNPFMEDLTGMPASRVLGRPTTEVFPEVMASGVIENLREALAGGPPTSREFEYVVPSTGRRGWVLGTYQPHRDNDGAVVGVVAWVLDISARHEAQAALERSESQFRAIFDSLGDPVKISEPGGRFLEVNAAAVERFGYTREQLLKMSIADINSPETVAQIPERTRRILESGTLTFETEHVKRDGTRIPAEVLSRAIEFHGRPAVVSIYRDITERKRAEEALRVQARFLQQLIDALPLAIMSKGLDGQVQHANAEFTLKVGLAAGDVMDHAPVSRWAIHEARDSAVLRDGSIQRYEGDVQDGSQTRRIMYTKAPVRADDGSINGVVTAALDITDRYRAELELKESEERFRSLFEHAADGIFIVDLTGRIITANKAAADSLGYTQDELAGLSVADIVIAGAQARMTLHIRTLLEQSSTAFETVEIRRDGARFPVEVGLTLIDMGGEPRILAIARDISERKRAEEALRTSEEKFRSLFDNAADAIFIHAPNGKFLEVNRAACERLGYTRLELLQMGPTDIDAPEFAAVFADRSAEVMAGRTAIFESAHVHRDGTRIPIELSSTAIQLGGQPAILSIARDISEWKRAEEERVLLEEQLRQVQKMEGIGQLAGGVAHDFNNLLTAIRGYASLALLDLPADSAARDDVHQIEQAADRAAGLTRQLLTFARRDQIKPEVVNLSAAVDKLRPMLERGLPEDVRLVTATSSLGGLIRADVSHIDQVVLNLAVNAADAMQDGGVLTIEVTDVDLDEDFARQHGLASPGHHALISVTDTGSGMDEATLGHLFEPFFTTKEPGKGTGLGLATVYGIVRAYGGYVGVTSEPDKGSTFAVYLPCVGDIEEPGIHETKAVDELLPPQRTGTILLVEDEESVRGFAARVLARAGLTVIDAESGSKAVEIDPTGIDLLLTDVVMPLMNGREVADRLQARKPNLPVLFMSGHADETIVTHGVVDPDIRYLRKPFTAQTLLQAVDEALAEA